MDTPESDDEEARRPEDRYADWRLGFEIEMLMGDLGLKKYRQYCGDAMDVVTQDYCRALAAHLKEATGESWQASMDGYQKGRFCVTPEYDLDPLFFPDDAVGGVELVTPPLVLADAEEMRSLIIEAVLAIDGGFVMPSSPELCGWHLNVDRGRNTRPIDVARTAAGMFWHTAELPLLLRTRRFGSRHTSPQTHAYGPALINAFKHPVLAPTQDEIDAFIHAHCGRSKAFATNFAKVLDRGYVELRHASVETFFDNDLTIEETFADLFLAVSGESFKKEPLWGAMAATFKDLAEWTRSLEGHLDLVAKRSSSLPGREGKVLYKGRELAHFSWNGQAEISMLHPLGESHFLDFRLEMTCGVDADEIPAAIAVLAMDALIVRSEELEYEVTFANAAFEEELEKLDSLLCIAEFVAPPAASA